MVIVIGNTLHRQPMDRFQYLALMALCVVGTLPLEWALRARVYRQPVRLLRTLIAA